MRAVLDISAVGAPLGGRALIDTRRAGGLTVSAAFSDGGTSAVLEVRRNFTGRAGDGVAFAPPATLSASTTSREGLDVGPCPYAELVVTTAGAAGETVHIDSTTHDRRA